MAGDQLERLARDFAGKIQRLLNTTICDNVKITAVVDKPGTVLVGHRLSKKQFVSEPIPVRRGKGKPHCWLGLNYTFCWDDPHAYMTVLSSFFAVYAADETALCHIDYERNKTDGYPDAHIQVIGDSPALAAWPGVDRPLGKLHFPAGGRRYRPILEDVIDFLVAEQLVPELPPGGAEVIAEGRAEFNRNQLRAAIRRDMETARQAVEEFGRRERDGSC